ncbi:AAA family ATPase [Streptomyces sp. NA02950]|uniref:helix-turn-helix transcriptional regulator n=1 Tax=Streptomyces sp. NA02950 TaxID=2742137 RepID=UPI00158FE5DF|nr:LuxR family transcriptional regulator [Streptomyces sp. NA02950]QKV96446.1 AAA family ATPase [Streptomyces sp. NA02950]
MPVVGRAEEQRTLAAMAAAARDGHSTALVLRGAAGIGKSALLRDLAEGSAEGLRTLWAMGVRSEAGLPFAGLHQVLRPLLRFEGRLPPPQRAALHSAFGMDTASPDSFLVALAALTLLSEAAHETPLLLLVDDAQWIDAASADTLGFVARRLGPEGVAMVLAVRDGSSFQAPGVPELTLRPLDTAAAGELLDQAVPEGATAVRELLIREAEGNPLALTELSTALSRDQLRGAVPLTDGLPLTKRLHRILPHSAEPLLTEESGVLLLAAAEPEGSLATILGAADHPDRALNLLHQAASARLLSMNQQSVRYRHPLYRSVIYQGASPDRRRAAHLALARAVEDDDRRIWHLAAAATGPDDELARSLVKLARRTRHTGDAATAARALRRAATLTSAPRHRARWLIDAAECSWTAAEHHQAALLLSQAEPLADTSGLRARLAQLRGAIIHASSDPVVACATLLDGARLVLDSDPELARETLTMAARSAWIAGDPVRLDEVAGLLERLQKDCPEPEATVSRRMAERCRYLSGLADAADTAGPTPYGTSCDDRHRAAPLSSLPGTGVLPWAGPPTFLPYLVGVADTVLDAYQRTLDTLHRDGSAGALPMLLAPMAALQLVTGRWTDAVALGTEGVSLADETRQLGPASHLRALLAWLAAVTGDGHGCHRLAQEALDIAEPHRISSAAALAYWSLGLQALSDGRPDRAAPILAEVTAPDSPRFHFMISWLAYPDLVEALVRAGEQDRARDALSRFERQGVPDDATQLHAALQRCRALLAPDTEADTLFRRAQRAAGLSMFELGRTQLLYGEWLRRRHRVKDAREQLRRAEERLRTVGAVPWAELAHAELRAAGVRGTGIRAARPPAVAPSEASEASEASEPSPSSPDTLLTARELQVARLAAQGMTNGEIAARLFLSPRTVGYHLYKVFPKLGITSRNQLSLCFGEALLTAGEHLGERASGQ